MSDLVYLDLKILVILLQQCPDFEVLRATPNNKQHTFHNLELRLLFLQTI